MERDIRKNHITIQGWMVQDLDLKGNDLLCYGLIYGFTQDGQTEFTGSLDYICAWLNTTRPTASKAISNLCDSELVIKRVEMINNVTFNRYKVNLDPIKKLYRPHKETLPPPHKETLPNNIIDNINNNNYFIIRKDLKIFQKNIEKRYDYENYNYIIFIDNSEVFEGKVVIPELFLIDFMQEIHAIRFEGILRLFEGSKEARQNDFLSVSRTLFKERCSSTFQDIDHFFNTVRKIKLDIEKSKSRKSYPKTEKITFEVGQDNASGW
jgi:hypothetical protein